MPNTKTIVRKVREGKIEYNDGEFAVIQTYGIEGVEKNLLMERIQTHREDTKDTTEEFRRRFALSTVVRICTTTEITNNSEDSSTDESRLLLPKAEGADSHELIGQIRSYLNSRYPDDDDTEMEHPMTAVGIVLVSSVILKTTDVNKLARLTGYSLNFISAVAFNMTHNKLWAGDEYDESEYLRWFSPDGFITDDRALWEHLEIACGGMWMPGIETESRDTCKIYWDEQRRTKRMIM